MGRAHIRDTSRSGQSDVDEPAPVTSGNRRQAWEWVRRGGAALLESAFPSICVSCGEIVEASPYHNICGGCSRLMKLIEDPRCLTCGFPFFGDAESQAYCSHCEHLDPEFGKGRSLALFRGPLRAVIHGLKYENGLWALRDLRRLMSVAPDLASYVDGATLVPVPLHPRKRRERGYNQSALIVGELTEVFTGARSESLLERVVDTESQTRFNRQERIRNLRNAFSLKAKHAIDPAKRYVIVDDVFTTGSTLNACAAGLRRAGALRVDVLTIGHG